MGYAVADGQMVMNGLLSERMGRMLYRASALSASRVLLVTFRAAESGQEIVDEAEGGRFWIVKRGGVC